MADLTCDVDAILARIAELEQELGELKAQVAPRGAARTRRGNATSRRVLLASAGAAVAGVTVFGDAKPAAAANGDPVRVGMSTTSFGPATYVYHNGTDTVLGVMNNGSQASPSPALSATANNGVASYGRSQRGFGVEGVSTRLSGGPRRVDRVERDAGRADRHVERVQRALRDHQGHGQRGLRRGHPDQRLRQRGARHRQGQRQLGLRLQADRHPRRCGGGGRRLGARRVWHERDGRRRAGPVDGQQRRGWHRRRRRQWLQRDLRNHQGHGQRGLRRGHPDRRLRQRGARDRPRQGQRRLRCQAGGNHR